MALALKKYTLVPTDAGTLDPLFPDGNSPPETPVLGTVIETSAVQLDIPLATPSTGGVAPLSYVLERSSTSSSAGFSVVSSNAYSITVTNYSDAGLTPVTQYWYRTYSVDSNTVPRMSAYSNVVSGITDVISGDVTPPSVPAWAGGGTGTPVVTTTTINISWLAATDS